MTYFFKKWVLLLIFSSCIFGMLAVVVQQNYRQNANDPQIQMAEDAVSRLSRRESPSIPLATKEQLIDAQKSLDPFLIIYDAKGNILSSNLKTVPLLPTGVIADAQKKGELRFTWQPANGFRIAAVIVPVGHITKAMGAANNGFVLAGRSLREIEKRESNLLYEIIFGWIITNSITAFVILFLHVLFPKRK